MAERARCSFLEEHPYQADQGGDGCFLPPEAGGQEEDDGDSDAEEGDEGPAPIKEVLGKCKEENDQTKRVLSRRFTIEADITPVVVHVVKIRPDNYNDKRHCLPDGQLKKRRGIPHVKASELINGLEKIGDQWVFPKALNAWPSFTGWVLQSVVNQKKNVVGQLVESTIWDAKSGKPLPDASTIPRYALAKFLAPAWSAIGWSAKSPGFVWWFSEQHGAPRVLYGEQMLNTLRADTGPSATATATAVHAFAHRYATGKESFKDSQTWHCGCVVEWSHGAFTTLIELAYLQGCSGYGGKANWCEDKLEAEPALYRAMDDGLKRPWSTELNEVRIFDLPLKNKVALQDFMDNYSNKSSQPVALQRFFDPVVYASAPVRLRSVRPADLAGYCLNYCAKIPMYEKYSCNCQTFACDLFGFLSGKVGQWPYSAIVRTQYRQQVMAFLHRPEYMDASQ